MSRGCGPEEKALKSALEFLFALPGSTFEPLALLHEFTTEVYNFLWFISDQDIFYAEFGATGTITKYENFIPSSSSYQMSHRNNYLLEFDVSFGG